MDDSILPIPNRMIVLGGGERGCRYAAAFAALGTTVTVIDEREQPRADEPRSQWIGRLTALGCELLFGRRVVDVETSSDEVLCVLEDGWAYPCDRVVFAGI
jgi:pyruvate/2-oxoglutarate dehydrogenase complex dihydrolipoamide dehydrogenase (E3) component